MSIYFEGNGKPRAATVAEARDQFMTALKEARDEVLTEIGTEAYDSAPIPVRDKLIADHVIGGVLSILDGDSQYFPAMNLIPYVSEEDEADAKAAGANFFDSGSGDIGQGLAQYWEEVNS